MRELAYRVDETETAGELLSLASSLEREAEASGDGVSHAYSPACASPSNGSIIDLHLLEVGLRTAQYMADRASHLNDAAAAMGTSASGCQLREVARVLERRLSSLLPYFR
jgi:hypothetical protein